MHGAMFKVVLLCGLFLLLPTGVFAMAKPSPVLEDSGAPACEPYPESPREELAEDINGYEIQDPYRWMEEEGRADAWIDAQNARTRRWLEKHQIPGLAERVTAIFDIGYVGGQTQASGRLFYVKREGDIEQAILFVRIDGQEKALIDPNQLDPNAQTTIDWYYPSRDGRLLAYGLSKDGSEDSTLYVMNVDTGEHLDDVIPETRHSSVAWLHDGSGFFYTRYPEGDRYNRRAYFHALGRDWREDPLIFGDKKLKTDWTALGLSHEGDHLLVMEFRGWTQTDVYLYDIAAKTLKPLLADLDSLVKSIAMAEGKIYLLTTHDAPKGRVVRFNASAPAPADWETVIPEGEHPLEAMELAGSRLLLQTLENVANHLYVHERSGARIGEIPLPTLGTVDSFSVDPDTGEGLFLFTSFFYPVTLFQVSIFGDGPFQASKTVSVTADFDTEAYEVQQVSYPSYDGTRVNMFLVHHKGFKPSGHTPTLLYGYGGFQVSMAPYFSRRVLTFIERGGLYAVANIRGGGEFGKEWHQAGTRANKHQVFRDFEYAARWLIARGYTQPKHLIVEGGSNGGLLMGAMMTQAPELFAAALGSVGLFDMIRYHRFPPGELWVPEYGNADEPGDTGFLLGYSPYHQVLPGVAYPAFYGDTADTDTRVHWVHTAKFIAALQGATSGKAPILFRLERQQGHGAGKRKTDIAQDYIDKFTFMFTIAGDPAAVQ